MIKIALVTIFVSTLLFGCGKKDSVRVERGLSREEVVAKKNEDFVNSIEFTKKNNVCFAYYNNRYTFVVVDCEKVGL